MTQAISALEDSPLRPAAEAAPSSGGAARERAVLAEAIEHARHHLPSQFPIRSFVHHNTLHAFQYLPFDEAVARAAALFGTEPYETEEAFFHHLARGRITRADLAAVIAEEPLPDAPLFDGAPSVRALRALRLEHPLEAVEGPALRWLLEESDALRRFHDGVSAEARARVLASAQGALGRVPGESEALEALYRALARHTPKVPARSVGPRPRDRILHDYGVDIDEWVSPRLVRLVSAFLDQGVAYWPMPSRERGLLAAFRDLYRRPLAPPDPWLRGLAAALDEQARAGHDAERVVLDALRAIGAPPSRWDDLVEGTLATLPGWAGMMSTLEARPDRAPVHAPPCRLVEYLAVALTLEAHAVAYVERAHHGERDDGATRRPEEPRVDDARVFEAFLLAQLAGLGPHELGPADHARAFLAEVAAFGSVERRRLWHAAYERRHRVGILDALLAHTRLGTATPRAPVAQVICCFDEREESLRRHLEELDPGVETLGFAGNFGVFMAYRGLRDARPRPLCPPVVRPRHLIVEEPIEPAVAHLAAARRKAIGTVQHASHVGSQTAVRGALTGVLGLAAVVPLIGRILFPRQAERVAHAIAHAAVPGPATRLRLERPEGDDAPGDDGFVRGFTVAEMADIVENVLSACGVQHRLAPLVVLLGHGSSSLNNPHEAAHDCGATGGGRGGPNARAFAAMANHPGVRARLAERGIAIAPETVFVGGYHNTCDDHVEYFDLDLVPATHRDRIARVRADLERARTLDAHERCRRFESVSTGIDPEGALAHVEGRAVDLGEPRPEYGHATNAICVLGRRARTRGLFLDRRAFVVSYDPTTDPDGAVLGPLLEAVTPVGAGINLEYYFSFVDPVGYGCGTKLPHNIVGLIGVMDGHASDLRTGLPWQMVEIHEPVRMLTIIEAEPALLERLVEASPAVREVVVNRWVQVVAWSPSTGQMSYFSRNGFVPYEPSTDTLPIVERSADHYRGHREHLACARVEAALRTEPS